jgi:hypothetical protein
MNRVIERPCSILESIEKSLQEMAEHKKGKKKLKSLEESMKLWSEWAEDVS